jgi:hypothetical protein
MKFTAMAIFFSVMTVHGDVLTLYGGKSIRGRLLKKQDGIVYFRSQEQNAMVIISKKYVANLVCHPHDKEIPQDKITNETSFLEYVYALNKGEIRDRGFIYQHSHTRYAYGIAIPVIAVAFVLAMYLDFIRY